MVLMGETKVVAAAVVADADVVVAMNWNIKSSQTRVT